MGPPPPHALSMRTLAAYASQIPGKNDGEEFAKLQVALGWFGLEPRVQEGLWEVLLGALHLGNVIFDDNADEVVDAAARVLRSFQGAPEARALDQRIFGFPLD